MIEGLIFPPLTVSSALFQDLASMIQMSRAPRLATMGWSRHWTQEDVGFPLPPHRPRNFQWLAIAFLKGATLLQPAF